MRHYNISIQHTKKAIRKNKEKVHETHGKQIAKWQM